MTKIPTLTSAGWIGDISTQAIQMMAWFRASEHSQTTLYPNEIASLPYLQREYGHDPALLSSNINNTLKVYFKSVFNEVNVNTKYSELNQDGEYTVQMDVVIFHEGKQYSLGRLLTANTNEIITYEDTGA